jgi:hypothetical protein
MFGHTGLGMLICRIERIPDMYAYALPGMLTHGSANPAVFPQRLPCSLVIHPEGSQVADYTPLMTVTAT